MTEPTVTCSACQDKEVCRPAGSRHPVDAAERRLAKRCKAKGHVSLPTYRAGIGFTSRTVGQ